MPAARTRPEVLAPVGSPDCLAAAVAGGADAVYLGLRHFNARGRAENFRKADLPRQVAYLHSHGLKCYLVMNTLIHDDEFAKALEMAAVAADSDVDAVIIQDLGLWRVLAREIPKLKRHASTQMTVHHPSQVEVLAKLGAERVILARELTLSEVAACTNEAKRLGIETEHFVHGALCYAYSGQCLMSNFAGCRSANRGTCAQNCRFDYFSDGSNEIDTELSMKDFSLIGKIGALAEAGVASLKIEGRLKGPDYVYTTSRVYRAASDAWQAGKKFDVAAARDLLRDVFSRGLTDAPLAGDYTKQSRMHRYAPERDRIADATLITLDRKAGRVELRADKEPKAGQGFEFAYGMLNGGFLITAVDPVERGIYRCRVRMAEHGPPLPGGLPLFRNSDHERKREAAAAMASVDPARFAQTIAVDLDVSGKLGEPLRVEARSADGRSVTVASEQKMVAAASAPLDEALLRDKLGSFGGTPFHLGKIILDLAANGFLPASTLKSLRRQVVEALEQQQPAERPATSPTWTAPEPGTPKRKQAKIIVVVNSLDAAGAALQAGAQAAWLDDAKLDLWSAKAPSIDRGRFVDGSLWLRHRTTAAPSPHLAAIGLPVVAGHVGVLMHARALGLRAIADLSLNVLNTETLAELGELGAEAAVISLECSSREVARLAARCATGDFPALVLVAHGRLPAMLTRQDHELGVGAEKIIRAVERDGGLPYQLQRRAGGETVVWEGRRLCCPEQVADTATLVDAWVLELADLAPDAVAELTAAYVDLSAGRRKPDEVARIAERHAPFGLFPGHLEHGSRELDLVLERQALA